MNKPLPLILIGIAVTFTMIGVKFYQVEFYGQVLKKDILENPAEYQVLVRQIENYNFSHGSSIDKKKIPDAVADKIEDTKIGSRLDYLTVSKTKNADCEGTKLSFIIGKWNLEYTACPDHTFPAPGSHEETGFIEVWGVNENWYVWVDNDFI